MDGIRKRHPYCADCLEALADELELIANLALKNARRAASEGDLYKQDVELGIAAGLHRLLEMHEQMAHEGTTGLWRFVNGKYTRED